MSKIQPFNALRPAENFAAGVASRPYDVLNREEAKKEAAENTASFLHITKSEIDLPESVDIHDPSVYEKAKENLKAFIDNHILVQEASPAYYIYQLVMNGKSQTGLVAVSSVDDYEQDVIKKHEFTRPEKEQDRINHITITGAQTGNVFLAYRDVPVLNELISQWKDAHTAIYDFVADDGIRHSVWLVDNPQTIRQITDIFEKQVPETYIADGHHRAASAAKVRKGLGAAKTPASDYFLTTLFPASELQILDYNRVITDLNGLTTTEFLEKLSANFTVTPSVQPVKPAALHHIGLYIDHTWYELVAKPGSFDEQDPVGVLDISVLQKNVLGPILGILDQRTDKRIDFVGGIRGLEGLTARVDAGEMVLAFSLYPVDIQQLFAIADSGNVMPPKSTWFEPKLRDGLLTHLIK
ncbi:Uncharacterized conserved protein, DUF1015 family [Arachidicoccus rhizosphaerae]|jgi:uncharacterized protein (DUF1015 family)|uniref:Uncharacterized conserved protein, DUF1015 family n=1 Tax=Arachidicoccus rhizosphaerae TaxID=551991 RepID=A0A1H3ZLF0_9BACT|nr:DUF1015 family protein [Arachidicoccus rhizosphaerae]SEA24609.1 Uncharacterized conserved protein, DUF1015 family [Arachidicoccus rhizosphaerae]